MIHALIFYLGHNNIRGTVPVGKYFHIGTYFPSYGKLVVWEMKMKVPTSGKYRGSQENNKMNKNHEFLLFRMCVLFK